MREVFSFLAVTKVLASGVHFGQDEFDYKLGEGDYNQADDGIKDSVAGRLGVFRIAAGSHIAETGIDNHDYRQYSDYYREYVEGIRKQLINPFFRIGAVGLMAFGIFITTLGFVVKGEISPAANLVDGVFLRGNRRRQQKKNCKKR